MSRNWCRERFVDVQSGAVVFAVLSVIPVKNIRELLMCWALPSLRSHYKYFNILV